MQKNKLLTRFSAYELSKEYADSICYNAKNDIAKKKLSSPLGPLRHTTPVSKIFFLFGKVFPMHKFRNIKYKLIIWLIRIYIG